MTRRMRLSGVLAVSAALAVAGCGDGRGGPSTPTVPQADSAAMQRLQDCLSKHGVELPQGGAPPQGGPPAGGGPPPSGGQPPAGGIPKGQSKAFQACRQYAPQGGLR